MKEPRIVDALNYLSDDIVSDAISFEPKHKKYHLAWRFVACATIVALIFGVIPFFNKDNEVSPLVVTAYALERDGSLSSHIMEENVRVPLSIIEIEPSVEGFLFSCPLEDPEGYSTVTLLSSEFFPDNPVELLYEFIEENGIQYFYFVPAEGEELPINFNVNINDEGGDQYRYEIEINLDDHGYTAILQNVTVSYAD